MQYTGPPAMMLDLVGPSANGMDLEYIHPYSNAHPYQYGRSNPVRLIDPSGLFDWNWGDVWEGVEIVLGSGGDMCRAYRGPCSQYKNEVDFAKASCLVQCGTAFGTEADAIAAAAVGQAAANGLGFAFNTPEHSAIRHCVTVGVLAMLCHSCACALCTNDARDRFQTMCQGQSKGALRRALSAGSIGAKCAGCKEGAIDPVVGAFVAFQSQAQIISCCIASFKAGKIDLGN